jgi:hypothetical protein
VIKETIFRWWKTTKRWCSYNAAEITGISVIISVLALAAFGINTVIKQGIENRELNKCIPVCHRCHRFLHAGTWISRREYGKMRLPIS